MRRHCAVEHLRGQDLPQAASQWQDSYNRDLPISHRNLFWGWPVQTTRAAGSHHAGPGALAGLHGKTRQCVQMISRIHPGFQIAGPRLGEVHAEEQQMGQQLTNAPETTQQEALMIVCVAVVGQKVSVWISQLVCPHAQLLFEVGLVLLQNNALFIEVFSKQEALPFHYIVHCALDAVEEKGEGFMCSLHRSTLACLTHGAMLPAVTAPRKGPSDLIDAYLGLLYPTEDYKVSF